MCLKLISICVISLLIIFLLILIKRKEQFQSVFIDSRTTQRKRFQRINDLIGISEYKNNSNDDSIGNQGNEGNGVN